MWLKKHKKNQQRVKVKQYLITVNILGSSGPIRFFVNENELVADVIDSALKNYAREDRLPVLGSSNVNDFLLYCSKPVHDALCPSEKIGACGVRDFVLCKTQNPLDALGRKINEDD
ncbi:hypothetical protein IFM89_014927 [Coptis chinensis]|uniref:DUF7054 domain-containing protein n=1 Tax=Coptis chinensis TaxID=261450 RepID=A0A835H680_9MAGN|nr:hypothetical protein IFM89_014927 [Coptis chinensis]